MRKLVGQIISEVLSEVLSQKLALQLLATLAAVMSFAVVMREYLSQFVPQPAEQWAVLTTAAALAGLLAAVASFFYYRPKLKFITSVGAWMDVKTNTYYCHSCKSKKLSSPLYASGGYLRCVVANCPTVLHDPDYVPPSPTKEKKKPSAG